MYGTRALRKVGWRRRLKILLKEELHNLYSAKSKLEGWSGRKCSTHEAKLVAVYNFRCQCLCTECKGQWVTNFPHSDSYQQRVLVAILSLWRPEFDPTPVRVRFVMEKLTWDRFFSRCFDRPLPLSFHNAPISLVVHLKPKLCQQLTAYFPFLIYIL
jgi:hypothetical protein